MKSVVVGSTGLVGGALIEILKQQAQNFVCLTRRPQESAGKNNAVVDFHNDSDLRTHLVGDILYYCFGTTLKAAGSREKFLDVEWGLGQKILKFAKDGGVKTLVLISSQGAAANSPILYSRAKGQIEEYAKGLGFDSLYILRPSLLLGNRTEVRYFEGMAQTVLGSLAPFMKGPLLKLKPIQGHLVAVRMFELAKAHLSGTHIYENDQLHVGFEGNRLHN